MNSKPDIILTGRRQRSYDSNAGELRELYLYEIDLSTDEPIFRYRFTEWDEDSVAYFKYSKCGKVFFRRENEEFGEDDPGSVSESYRSYAYSAQEIRSAIENYLVEKVLLTEIP